MRATLAGWWARRFSYGVVAGASLLGWLWPTAAPAVLGPVLLVGLLGLGLAHGACDQHVLPAAGLVRQKGRRYLRQFVPGYLGVAALAGLGWWCWPGAAVAAFFLLTVWHWGSADAPAQPGQRAQWLAHSVLRGALLFAVPAQWWPTKTQQSVNGLLQFAGAQPLSASWFGHLAGWLGPAVGLGHLVLWASYARQGAQPRWLLDLGEVLLLVGLFSTLPPLLALGTYFVFWHSLQHVLRLNRLFGYAAPTGRRWASSALGRELLFFGRQALPLLLVTLGALAVVYLLWPARLAAADAWLGVAVVAAAVLTLPHALLVSVVLDAANWRTPQPKGLE